MPEIVLTTPRWRKLLERVYPRVAKAIGILLRSIPTLLPSLSAIRPPGMLKTMAVMFATVPRRPHCVVDRPTTSTA